MFLWFPYEFTGNRISAYFGNRPFHLGMWMVAAVLQGSVRVCERENFPPTQHSGSTSKWWSFHKSWPPGAPSRTRKPLSGGQGHLTTEPGFPGEKFRTVVPSFLPTAAQICRPAPNFQHTKVGVWSILPLRGVANLASLTSTSARFSNACLLNLVFYVYSTSTTNTTPNILYLMALKGRQAGIGNRGKGYKLLNTNVSK